MTQLIYDGSMAGLLTAIFEVYERKLADVRIGTDDRLLPDAFAARIDVMTDALKARRVWVGLGKRADPEARDQFWYAFLSELPEKEDMLLAYARYAFDSNNSVAADYGHPAVLFVVQTARKVWREKHRMEAFVRFELLSDGLFYATVAPDHNVLPLIIPHFRNRYGDQNWMIYDLKRKYGIHYDKALEKVTEVQVSWDAADQAAKQAAYAPDEPLYQQLWQAYFHATGIPERANRKLHIQHVPLRYWRYLTEKRL